MIPGRHIKRRCLAVLFLALSACGSGSRAPQVIDFCELSRYSQQLVSISAMIAVDDSGTTWIGDPRCASTRAELRLTNAAYRASDVSRLKNALVQARAGHPPRRVVAALTGVLAASPDGAAGAVFTAETLGAPSLQ